MGEGFEGDIATEALESLRAYKDYENKVTKEPIDTWRYRGFQPHGICPNCGYCSHCGRGGKQWWW